MLINKNLAYVPYELRIIFEGIDQLDIKKKKIDSQISEIHKSRKKNVRSQDPILYNTLSFQIKSLYKERQIVIDKEDQFLDLLDRNRSGIIGLVSYEGDDIYFNGKLILKG